MSLQVTLDVGKELHARIQGFNRCGGGAEAAALQRVHRISAGHATHAATPPVAGLHGGQIRVRTGGSRRLHHHGISGGDHPAPGRYKHNKARRNEKEEDTERDVCRNENNTTKDTSGEKKAIQALIGKPGHKREQYKRCPIIASTSTQKLMNGLCLAATSGCQRGSSLFDTI